MLVFLSGILIQTSCFHPSWWSSQADIRHRQIVPHRKNKCTCSLRKKKKNNEIDAKWFLVNADSYIMSALSMSAFSTRELLSDRVKTSYAKGQMVSLVSSHAWSCCSGSAKFKSLWQKGRFWGLCGMWFVVSDGLVWFLLVWILSKN